MTPGSRCLFVALRLALFWSVAGLPGRMQAHGDLHERITSLTRTIDSSPTNANLLVLRGELQRLHEEPKLAIADFERALAINPDLEPARLGLARGWMDEGKPAQARAELDDFLIKHPRHPEALLVRARALSVLGERRAAAADYTGAIGATSTPWPEIYLERAGVLAADGKIDEAIAGLDEGVARAGRLAPLESRAVDLELGRKRYDAALSRLDLQIARAPRKEFLLCRRGNILEQATRPREARAAYLTAAEALRTLPPERQATKAVYDLRNQIQTALTRLEPISREVNPSPGLAKLP